MTGAAGAYAARMADWDLKKLRILRTLHELGTVTATAEALHMTPSAVSQQLTGLAKALGVTLLEAQGRRVRLTDAAELVLRHAEAVFAQLERADAELLGYLRGEAGQVRVGAFSTAIPALVVPAVQELRRTHPGLSVVVREAEAEAAYELLAEGSVDLALSLAAHAPTARDPKFSRVALLADPLDVALPAATGWPPSRGCGWPIWRASPGSSAAAGPGRRSPRPPARTPGSCPSRRMPPPTGARSGRWSRRGWGWRWCPGWRWRAASAPSGRGSPPAGRGGHGGRAAGAVR